MGTINYNGMLLEDPMTARLKAESEAFKVGLAMQEIGAIDKDAVKRMLKDFNPQPKETLWIKKK